MSSLGIGPIRPGFDQSVAAPAGEVSRRIQALVGSGAGQLAGNCLPTHFQLTVQEGERHFWSPWLHLEIEGQALEGQAVAQRAIEHRMDPVQTSTEVLQRVRVRGYFTPAPSLWTGFMLLGIALITLAFFTGIWGLVQMYLAQPPIALLGTAACLLGLLMLAGISRAGQRLAAEQMERLQARVQAALEAAAAEQV